MKKPNWNKELKDLLALGEADTIETMGVDGEEPSTGWGDTRSPYTAEDGRVDHDRVLMALDEGRLEMMPKGEQTPDLGCLWQPPEDPGLVYWEAPEAASLLRGAPHCPRGDDLLFDLRAEPEPPVVHFVAAGEEYVAHVTAGGVHWAQIIREASEALADAFNVRAEPLAVPAPPPINELLAGQPCPDWLMEMAASQLQSPSVLERLSGPGTLARHWTPGGHGEADAVLQELLSGEPTTLPFDQARQWAGALDEGSIELLERLAIAETDDLSELLASIHQAAATEAPELQMLVRDLVRRRDTLASAEYVLRQADGAESISRALAALDEAARESLLTLSMAEDPGDEALLSTVSWKQPDAWWGKLARQAHSSR